MENLESYKRDIEQQIVKLKKELEWQEEKRTIHGTSSPKFMEIQSDINNLTTNIATLKSRKENAGKDAFLPEVYTLKQ